VEQDFIKRVGGLESDVKRLSQNVSGLESDVKNVIRVVNDVGDSVRFLTSKISESHKTDWQAIAGFAGVLVAIMSSIGYMALEPYKQITQRNAEELKEHKREMLEWRLKHLQRTHEMELKIIKKMLNP
jgi:uncharacterized protein YoxC